MKKARTVKQKVMGRPRTGITPLMGFRADAAIRAAIVKWAENQPDMPTLSEAIRRLVELGLTVKPKSVPTERQRVALADLASKTIDSLTAETPDSGEKASRKHHLIKGPEEFRKVRMDRPKRK
jgi:regulator of PEP synthase PpsR (kinase-PPPase family)